MPLIKRHGGRNLVIERVRFSRRSITHFPTACSDEGYYMDVMKLLSLGGVEAMRLQEVYVLLRRLSRDTQHQAKTVAGKDLAFVVP